MNTEEESANIQKSWKQLRAAALVIKRHFPNLTTEKTLDIAIEVATALKTDE